MSSSVTSRQRPVFMTRGDLDGFFGLFIDNLLHLLLIATLCPMVCGIPMSAVVTVILPAAGISILLGNVFYGLQALGLGFRQKRGDATAMPYGINSFTLMAFVFLVMGPVYKFTDNAATTWKIGLCACILSGLIEFFGAGFAVLLRKWIPRAAMLSSLAGIALAFIAMAFVFEIFSSPLIALAPLILIVLLYSGRVKLPLGIPGGLFAISIGVAIAWGLHYAGFGSWAPDLETTPQLNFDDHQPKFVLLEIWAFVQTNQDLLLRFLPVIIPVSLFGLISSLQCLESAEASGDRYGTVTSLMVNGMGTLLAASFGSPFPTTIHIGYPGWKAMGGRWMYSILAGAAIAALCLSGAIGVVLQYVPREAVLGVLVWIGVAMMAQAFGEVPKRHLPAVAFGLIPALAAWALIMIVQVLEATDSNLREITFKLSEDGFHVAGLAALAQGFLFTSIVYAATAVCVIDRKWGRAGMWMLLGALLAVTGIIHGYEFTEDGAIVAKYGYEVAWRYAAVYAGVGVLLLFGLFGRKKQVVESHEEGEGKVSNEPARKRVIPEALERRSVANKEVTEENPTILPVVNFPKADTVQEPVAIQPPPEVIDVKPEPREQSPFNPESAPQPTVSQPIAAPPQPQLEPQQFAYESQAQQPEPQLQPKPQPKPQSQPQPERQQQQPEQEPQPEPQKRIRPEENNLDLPPSATTNVSKPIRISLLNPGPSALENDDESHEVGGA